MSQQPQQDSGEILALPNFDDDTDGPISPVVRPRRGRRNIIIAISILLLIVLLAALFLPSFLRPKKPTTYQYQKVAQQPFFLTISATGPLQSGTYNVVFSGTGKLTEIDVAVGQRVTEGQVLAKLDKTSLVDALNQAKAAVAEALVTVGNGEASLGATEGQSQANNDAEATAVAIAKVSQGKTLSQSQANIAAAQATLISDQTNLINVQAQSQASINTAQTTLTSDQTNLTNVQAQSQASINTAYTQEQQAIATCNAQATTTTTPTPSTYDNCIQLAENQYNQAVTTANANTAAAQAKVTADQQQLNTARTTARANNDAAQAKVTADMQQLTTAQANAGVSNTTAQNQVTTSQSQLKTSQANAGLSDTTGQNQVNTAQSQLQTALIQQQTAQHNLDNATLKAPHAGIITTINGTVGGTPGVSTASTSATSTTAGAGTFIQIADDTALQVQANVNESDVANLQVGDAVQFTVSAYGDREFRGTVSAISPNGQTVSNVVTYPVTINVDMSTVKGAHLFPGMTANVTITVVNHQNTLLIPVGAVNFARLASGSSGSKNNSVSQLISKQAATSAMSQARQALVTLETQNPNLISESPIPAYVIEHLNGKFVAKPVVLGLTDDTVYEVLQGLSADDTIVVGVQSTQKGG